jgi:hypothetical protein
VKYASSKFQVPCSRRFFDSKVESQALTDCWKIISESFDGAQEERGPEMIEKFPFMLRFSKHSWSFSKLNWKVEVKCERF